MKLSMIEQEKYDLSIQVATQTGLTVFVFYIMFAENKTLKWNCKNLMNTEVKCQRRISMSCFYLDTHLAPHIVKSGKSFVGDRSKNKSKERTKDILPFK